MSRNAVQISSLLFFSLSGAAVHPLAFGAVVFRLGQVQGPASKSYAVMGEDQLVHDVVLPADRGSMFDRNGNDLAMSIPQTTIYADPREVSDAPAEAAALAALASAEPCSVSSGRSRAMVRPPRKIGWVTVSAPWSGWAEMVEKVPKPGTVCGKK